MELRKKREAIGLSQAKLSEISGVSQHLLSAYELGKKTLSESNLRQVLEALESSYKLTNIIGRRKRYRRHTYRTVQHAPSRVAKHIRTRGNIEYLDLLSSLELSACTAKRSAISLFSGGGGFSLGFKWANFAIKGFVEADPSLRAIYQKNFPAADMIGGDITAISDDDIERNKERIGEVDVIIGGPPCQGFSLSGKRQISDPRNNLFRNYLRFVKAFSPKIAVMENVKLLTSMKSSNGGKVKDEIEHAFTEHGYIVKAYEVNAKDYGVPQHRERIFFVALRKDLGVQPSFPMSGYGTGGDMFDSKKPWRTFADACSDLPYLESGEASTDLLHSAVSHPEHVLDWLWDVPEGKSAHENEEPSKRPPSGYNTTYKRQIWLEPASTIQTTFGMISGCRNVQPIATRSLTIREAARIQSFSDSYIFDGKQGSIRTAIGNAVPPLLAYQLGMHLQTRILDLVEVSGF